MRAAETVKTLITALQSADLELAASVLADGFKLVGLTPEALQKQTFLALQSELVAAMPDFSYNFSEVHHKHEQVTALIRISGTQTNDLSLPMVGLRTVAATGLAILLPQTNVIFRVEKDQVVVMECELVPGGGLAGLLQQIGAEITLMPRGHAIHDQG
ncbi:MAG TPA: hypothetical protein VL461_00145 [Dictyobacter sp.]|jgi:hypothetical protein|nr:hypothetical protein [Dictyobacter sp.]